MVARGRLAVTLLAALAIGCALSEAFKCYDGALSDTGSDKTCEGGMCKIEMTYSNRLLSEIKSKTGSCVADGTPSCNKYRSDHKAICTCKMDNCNSPENQNRALKSAVSHASSRSVRLLLIAPLLAAIHYNSR